MPKVKVLPKRIEAWSFSRWRDYEQCPAKAKFKHIDKIKEPGNAAMDRGSAIHKLAEDFAGGKLKSMPLELAKFKVKFTALKKLTPQCEQEWAFNREWGRVGWFDQDCWCRIKVDVTHAKNAEATIIDHKTGRYKPGDPSYREQLELYALGGFLIHRKAAKIICKLWFIDSGDEEILIFERKDLEKLKAKWEDRTKAMLTDTRFAPTPGRYCTYCFHRKANGGQCKF
jgi:RecB family exonuclease